MAKMKSNSVTWHEFQHNGDIKFGVRGAGEFMFERGKTSLECRHFAELQGWVKRIINMAALSRDTDTGKPATPQEKYDRMLAAATHYMSGSTDWTMRGTAAPRDETGMVLMALMRVKGWTVEQAEGWIAKAMAVKGVDRKAVMKNVGANPDVLRMIGTIKAERAAQSLIDADDLLEDIEMDDEA